MYSIDNLSTFVNAQYPMVWIQTTDFFKGVELSIETHLSVDPTKKVYFLHPKNGLCSNVEGEWKPIIHFYADMDMYGQVFDLSLAASIVTKNKGVFILPGDAGVANKVGSDILASYETWRLRVFKKEHPVENSQFIFVGMIDKDKLDPFLLAMTWAVDVQTLDVNAATDMYTRMGSAVPEVFKPNSLPALVRQTTGFTENQAIASSVMSVAQEAEISADFVEAERRRIIGESGILRVIKPKISMAEIGGLQAAKDLLKGGVWINQNPEEAGKLGLVAPNRILLIGVPGTGKSALCEATAHELGYDMVQFGVSKMMSKWIGESESNTRAAFAQINAMTPITVWIDELGRDFSGSGSSNDAGTTDRAHGELLTGLQEMDRRNVLMAAANIIQGLPPEMLRADRFDKILFVGFPSPEERGAILRIYLGPEAPDEAIRSLIGVTESFTGAEIKSAIAETRFEIGTKLHRPPNTQEYGNAFRVYRNRVWLRRKAEIQAMYRQAFDEWDWASDEQKEEAKAYALGKLPSAGVTKKKVMV